MLAHMVIHVTLPAGFSCPGKKRAPNNVIDFCDGFSFGTRFI